MQGIIIKAISSFYYVKTDDGKIIELGSMRIFEATALMLNPTDNVSIDS